MKNIILVLFAVISLSSCVTRKACERKYPAIIKDSIVIKDSVVIKEKDSIVITTKIKDSIVVKEEVKGNDSIPCNENASYTIKRGGDTFKIKIKNGVVHFDYLLQGTISRYKTQIEGMERHAESMRYQSEQKSKQQTKVVVSVVEIYPLWLKILAIIGGLCIVLTIVKQLIKKTFFLLFNFACK